MQPHAEHEQHDANIRKLFRNLRLGYKPRSERAANDAGHQVPDDGREPQAVCHPAAEQRGREAHGQVEQQTLVMHRRFPTRNSLESGGMESYCSQRQLGEAGGVQLPSQTAQQTSDGAFMTDTTISTPAPRKRRGWLRAIAWVFGILIELFVVVYFVATSGAFFKGVILPRVGKAMNAQVTVSDASISPFSQVVLRNLKVQTTGSEPLVTATEVRLRYSLMNIIRGNIHVDEVALSSPTVTLVENADGTSNLDPILKAQQAKPGEQKPEQPAKPPGAKPMQLDLKKFALTDATIRQVKNHANGTRDLVELSHVNVTLDDLKNGQ